MDRDFKRATAPKIVKEDHIEPLPVSDYWSVESDPAKKKVCFAFGHKLTNSNPTSTCQTLKMENNRSGMLLGCRGSHRERLECC